MGTGFFHSVTSVSCEAVARREPLGDQVEVFTGPVWPLLVRPICRQVVVDQNPVWKGGARWDTANWSPVGEKAAGPGVFRGMVAAGVQVLVLNTVVASAVSVAAR